MQKTRILFFLIWLTLFSTCITAAFSAPLSLLANPAGFYFRSDQFDAVVKVTGANNGTYSFQGFKREGGWYVDIPASDIRYKEGMVQVRFINGLGWVTMSLLNNLPPDVQLDLVRVPGAMYNFGRYVGLWMPLGPLNSNLQQGEPGYVIPDKPSGYDIDPNDGEIIGNIPHTLQPIKASTGGSVNLATGAEEFSRELLSVQGVRRLSFAVRYSAYDSLNKEAQAPFLMPGWGSSLETRLRFNGQDMAFITFGGAGEVRFLNQQGKWVCQTRGVRLAEFSGAPNSESTLSYGDGSRLVFDGSGKLVSDIDSSGNQISYTYSGNNLQSITDVQTGKTISFTYSGNQLVSAQDNSGRTVSFNLHYGGLSRITDARGLATHYEYGDNLLRVVKDHNLNVITANTYDLQGRVVSQTDACGGVITINYTTDPNRVTTVTDRVGNVHIYNYNNLGQLISYQNPLGKTWSYVLDEFGRPISTISPSGRSTMHEYDADGNEISRTSGTLTAEATFQPGLSQPTSLIAPGGAATTIERNAAHLPTSITDPLGNVMAINYNSAGQPINISGPGGKSLSFSYQGGLPSRTTSSTGLHTDYSYDAAGRPSSITAPGNRVYSMAFDAAGYPTSMTGPGNRTVSTQYDSRGRPISVTLPNESGILPDSSPGVLASDRASNYGSNSSSSWINGSNGGSGFQPWVFTVSDNSAGATSPPFYANAFIDDPAKAGITGMSSPAFGLSANPEGTAASVAITRAFSEPMAVGDSFSFQWATNWDAGSGNKGFKIFAGGGQILNINQGDYPGHITCNGQIAIEGTSGYGTQPMNWTFTRSSATNLQITATPRNGEAAIAFSTNVTLSAAPDSFSFYATAMVAGDLRLPFFDNLQIVSLGNSTNSNQIARTFDGNHNLTSETDPSGRTTTYTYDAEDRLISITAPSNRKTTITRDVAGQITEVTSPAGKKTRFAYDDDGNLIEVTAPDGTKRKSSLDGAGLVASVTDESNHQTALLRNPAGEVSSVVSPEDRTRTFSYDPLGRLTRATMPSGKYSSVANDDASRRVKVADPAGKETTHLYDSDGRLTSTTTPGGQTTSYSYGDDGLLASVLLPSGKSVSFSYDSSGDAAAFTEGSGTTSLTRDVMGRVTATTKNGQSVQRTYDKLGRMTSYTDAEGRTVAYSYDLAGNLQALNYPDGTQVTYTYDLDGRMLSVTDWEGRVTHISRDANGRATSVALPNGTTNSFTYTPTSRISGIQASGQAAIMSRSIVHTPDGLVASETGASQPASLPPDVAMTYDSDNRLSTYNGSHVLYDADGNMLTIPAGLQTLTATYDASGRLESAGNVTSVYDPEGRRTKVTDSDGERTLVYDTLPALDRALMRLNPNGTTTKYVYGPGLLYEVTGSALRAYHSDSRGSTIALTSENGSITDTFSYGPYGERWSRTGNTDTPFQFCGQHGVQTDSNDLISKRARFYSPAIKRFVSQDSYLGTALSPISLNRYAYAEGNPISLIDPTGFVAQDVEPIEVFANLTWQEKLLTSKWYSWVNDDTANFAAGWGDVVGGTPIDLLVKPFGHDGVADMFRNFLGVNARIDKNSAFYRSGEGVGLVTSLILGRAEKFAVAKLPATLEQIKKVYDGYSASLNALESTHLALISIDGGITEKLAILEKNMAAEGFGNSARWRTEKPIGTAVKRMLSELEAENRWRTEKPIGTAVKRMFSELEAENRTSKQRVMR